MALTCKGTKKRYSMSEKFFGASGFHPIFTFSLFFLEEIDFV
jgi:hypothetical protein